MSRPRTCRRGNSSLSPRRRQGLRRTAWQARRAYVSWQSSRLIWIARLLGPSIIGNDLSQLPNGTGSDGRGWQSDRLGGRGIGPLFGSEHGLQAGQHTRVLGKLHDTGMILAQIAGFATIVVLSRAVAERYDDTGPPAVGLRSACRALHPTVLALLSLPLWTAKTA